MTRIIVASKEGLDVLQDGQLSKVVLSKPSIIQIGVSQKDIASVEKQGGSLVIHLKNGETIVLENFFNEATNTTDHSLVLPTEHGKFVEAQFDAQGKVIDYTGLNHVTDLAYTSSSQPASTMAVDDSPTFSMGNVLKAGLAVLAAEGLYLWAFDNDDKDDSSGPVDILAPAAPTATVGEDTVTVTGKAEANAKIYIKDAADNTVATGVADASGNFTIKLDKPLANGNKLKVVAEDAAGNTSKPGEIIGKKDTIAPDAPEAQLSEDGSILDGKTEPNATVKIYDASGKLLGTVTANKDGIFSFQLNPPLTSEAGGKVIAIDVAKNESEATLILAGKDTIPPKAPLLEVNKEGTVVEGKAEANTKVQIKDTDGKVIGSGTANAQGEFQITLSPALKESQKATIIVEDAAGNTSKPLEITSGYDTIAPDKPTAQINAEGTTITGTAEANAKIQITIGNKVIGTGTADAEGKFTINVSTVLTDKDKANITAIDSAGNSSVALEINGTKETAPDKPSFKVYDDNGTAIKQIIANAETDDTTPKFTVKAESNATLTIYDNGVAISIIKIGQVNASGEWSFTLDKNLALGKHTITLMQTDTSGLTSEISLPFTFEVVAPKTASLSDAAVDTAHVETVSVADSVGLNTLKLVQNTTNETDSQQQKSVQLDDLLKSSSTNESDPIAKLLSATESKPVVNEQSDVNNTVSEVTTNLDHLLPNTTSSVLQNLLDQTYPVV